MKNETIFVSDLDGTLLRGNGTLSEFSRAELTKLLESGVHFTVASARAWGEMVPVLGELPLTLPVIAINGAFITEYATGKHLVINNIDNEFAAVLYQHILDNGLLPFIVTHNGTEDCLYWQELKNEEMQWYHDTLHVHKDKRIRRIEDLRHALSEQVIAFAVMGPAEQVTALSNLLADEYPGLLENFLFENPYSPGHWWLTIHDRKACKSKAIQTLVEMTGHKPENLTVFGDHINDIKMFELAGKGVAVANAEEALKYHADTIIGSNDEDAVVRYIMEQMKD
jgi:Cof subfamily protein (haloacid dehalogenase superfamily)